MSQHITSICNATLSIYHLVILKHIFKIKSHTYTGLNVEYHNNLISIKLQAKHIDILTRPNKPSY